ncbi:MAG: signal peptidase I [Acidimicrobiia bacterium]|nr:signal peptidase I [Acidimicrobiia bacterium]
MRPSRRLALIGTATLLAYTGLRGRLRRYQIAEESMAPTLLAGDYVVAQPSRQSLERGDIIIFEHPHREGFELVKRVVGLPGEEIVISRGQVHANDAVLAEPWADGPTLPEGTWNLDLDQIFVLGDNRARSAGDSRLLGPVRLSAARWKVVGRYWPPGSVGRVGF